MPIKIIIGFFGNSAYFGDFNLNPFNFQHFNVNFLTLYKDGIAHPCQPLQPNFTGKDYARSYLTLFESVDSWYSEHSPSISMSEYSQGYCFFMFDLTKDNSINSHFNPP